MARYGRAAQKSVKSAMHRKNPERSVPEKQVRADV